MEKGMSENEKPAQGRLPFPAREPIAAQELASNVARLPSAGHWEKLRVLEAVLFAASEPLDETALAQYFPAKEDIAPMIEELQALYAGRGVNLVRIAGKWAFRTASDLSFILERHAVEPKKLSKAALETLAIIAYHQPVTRAEIEEVRGVSTSKGTLDVLMEMGWIRMRGRRRAPGRPVTYGTSEMFLEHFGFDNIKDLPGLAELKGAGLLDSNLPPGFSIPDPNDAAALMPDEDPLGDDPVEDDDATQKAEENSTQPLAEEDEAPEDAEEPEENVAQFPAQAMPLLKQG
jgi:segregation and condensation protein B